MHSFFASDVEFCRSAPCWLHQQPERSRRRWLQDSIVAAAVAVSGLLTLYSPPASLSKLDVDPVAVHRAAHRSPKHVPISAADYRAASRLRAAFVTVPPSDADREISPDYGL